MDTDGRRAKVAFTDDWIADAARRDFTINALSCTPDGDIYDPYRGLDDLGNGVVRFVGNAHDRIEEDILRLLRYFRFLAASESHRRTRLHSMPVDYLRQNYQLFQPNGFGGSFNAFFWAPTQKTSSHYLRASIYLNIFYPTQGLSDGFGCYVGLRPQPLTSILLNQTRFVGLPQF